MLCFTVVAVGAALYCYRDEDAKELVFFSIFWSVGGFALSLLLLGLSKSINRRRHRARKTKSGEKDLQVCIPRKRVLGMPPAVVMISLPLGCLGLGFYLFRDVSPIGGALVLCGVGTFIGFLLLGLSDPPRGGGRFHRPRD